MLPMVVIMLLPVIGLGLFLVMPWRSALPIYLAGVGLSAIYHRLMLHALSRRVRTGRQAMLGQDGHVTAWHGDAGTVRCRGEIWQACGEGDAERDLAPGDEIEVVGAEGLALVVRRVARELPAHRLRMQ
jgi:membrane protein implicated in regulation of membrane protease activity